MDATGSLLLCAALFLVPMAFMHLCYSAMQGVEYALVHAQEPILYVIRQQHRQSPTQG